MLSVSELRVIYPQKGGRGAIRAVDGVSLHAVKGECVGLVGESGCGKTTLGSAIVREAPIASGSIFFEGSDISLLSRNELQQYRRRVQMIFQDPVGSLNPRMTVGSAIGEILLVHGLASGAAERSAMVADLLRMVGLHPSHAARYPHEFSGGQRQRIGIARALAVKPRLVIADEPVSALDVSVQVQVLNLMRDLQEKENLTYLFVAHDLAVIRYMCRRAYVMYLGRIVEEGPVDELYSAPAHPYTEALLSAVPDIDRGLARRAGASRRIVLRGDVPSPIAGISGCPFHPRCHRARDICAIERPCLAAIGEGRMSACHFARDMMAAAV